PPRWLPRSRIPNCGRSNFPSLVRWRSEGSRVRIIRSPRPRTLPRQEMPINIRFDGDVVVLSNFARLMNDPRYVDASRDLRDLLDQGRWDFVLDLGGVRETGSSFLGVLMTLTRQIRQHRGEAILAHLSREMDEF